MEDKKGPSCTVRARNCILEACERQIPTTVGGHDLGKNGGPSSAFYIIKVSDLSQEAVWCEAKIRGNDVQPRVNPLIFTIGSKLFIFGGVKQHSQDTPEQIRSVSVAEFSEVDQQWIWTANDIPYPANHLIFETGVPILSGSESFILLTPGRASRLDKFEFKTNSLYFFNTKSYTFQEALATGSFPIILDWYDAMIFRPPSAVAPSIIICGRGDDKDQENIYLPKMWHFSLLTREFKRYEIARPLLGTTEMRRFVVVDHRIYLLGDKDDNPNKETYLMDSYIEVPLSVWSD